jgi:hypothetical protein
LPKKLTTNTVVPAGRYINTFDNSVTNYTAIDMDVVADMYLGSGGHSGYPRFPKHHDVGGDFGLLKSKTTAEGAYVGTIHGTGAYSRHHYTGKVYGEHLRPWALPTKKDGTAWGATAYNRMKPTKPLFPGANAFYEMREVPEMLRQELHKSKLKNIGSYFLALKFGWAPLLSDIQSMMRFYDASKKRIRWLLDHNGKPVRRRIQLVSDISDPVFESGTYPLTQPGFVSQFYKSTPTWKKKTVTSDSVWASAQFVYHLPPGPDDVLFKARMYDRLFGAYVSPEFVWNAIPWSWLADWFGNVGDILANIDSGVADKLAADWFYVMRETRTDITMTSDLRLISLADESTVSVSAISTSEATCKTRLKGDPFGFATVQQTLNSSQLSILGALGLSKVR